MPKRHIPGSRVIVTGASSGIGRALAVELARQGARVVATARRQNRLDDLRRQVESTGGTIVTLPGDVTDPALRQSLVDTARGRFGGLDFLVNNAGVGAMGRFEDADPARLRRVMEVNFFAPVELIRLALPLLAEGTRPIIVNVSSILGLRATPYSSEYSASKFALQGFSEALRAELVCRRIDVLVVSPGTTQTEFFDAVLEKTAEPSWPEHTPVTAETVAAATVRAMRRGRHAIIPYRWGKIFHLLNRLSPRLMDTLMAKYT
ncbi:MAG TPA: SDR family oxidoreductase [Thermoguttaceae bacterium]|nr:SDR family oxidoreductase [Thermoguttaceae bacterium]